MTKIPLGVPYVLPTRPESRVLPGIEIHQFLLSLQIPGNDQVGVPICHGQVTVTDHVLNILEIGA